MPNVKVRDPEGRELEVSEKAYQVVYKDEGWELLGKAKAKKDSKADQAPEPEPEE